MADNIPKQHESPEKEYLDTAAEVACERGVSYLSPKHPNINDRRKRPQLKVRRFSKEDGNTVTSSWPQEIVIPEKCINFQPFDECDNLSATFCKDFDATAPYMHHKDESQLFPEISDLDRSANETSWEDDFRQESPTKNEIHSQEIKDFLAFESLAREMVSLFSLQKESENIPVTLAARQDKPISTQQNTSFCFNGQSNQPASFPNDSTVGVFSERLGHNESGLQDKPQYSLEKGLELNSHIEENNNLTPFDSLSQNDLLHNFNSKMNHCSDNISSLESNLKDTKTAFIQEELPSRIQDVDISAISENAILNQAMCFSDVDSTTCDITEDEETSKFQNPNETLLGHGVQNNRTDIDCTEFSSSVSIPPINMLESSRTHIKCERTGAKDKGCAKSSENCEYLNETTEFQPFLEIVPEVLAAKDKDVNRHGNTNKKTKSMKKVRVSLVDTSVTISGLDPRISDQDEKWSRSCMNRATRNRRPKIIDIGALSREAEDEDESLTTSPSPMTARARGRRSRRRRSSNAFDVVAEAEDMLDNNQNLPNDQIYARMLRAATRALRRSLDLQINGEEDNLHLRQVIDNQQSVLEEIMEQEPCQNLSIGHTSISFHREELEDNLPNWAYILLLCFMIPGIIYWLLFL